MFHTRHQEVVIAPLINDVTAGSVKDLCPVAAPGGRGCEDVVTAGGDNGPRLARLGIESRAASAGQDGLIGDAIAGDSGGIAGCVEDRVIAGGNHYEGRR